MPLAVQVGAEGVVQEFTPRSPWRRLSLSPVCRSWVAIQSRRRCVACPLVRSSTLHPKRELSSTIVRQVALSPDGGWKWANEVHMHLVQPCWSPCARRGVWLRLGLTLNARQTGREGLRRSVVGGWETLHGLKMNQASKRGLPKCPRRRWSSSVGCSLASPAHSQVESMACLSQ